MSCRCHSWCHSGIFSFLLDLLVEIFTGAGIYSIITVVCVIIFIIAVHYIINGKEERSMSRFMEDLLCGIVGQLIPYVQMDGGNSVLWRAEPIPFSVGIGTENLKVNYIKT